MGEASIWNLRKRNKACMLRLAWKLKNIILMNLIRRKEEKQTTDIREKLTKSKTMREIIKC